MNSAAKARRIQKYLLADLIFESPREVFYSAICVESNRLVYLKTYKTVDSGTTVEALLSAESQVLKELNLPDFPQFVDIAHEGDVAYLVFEIQNPGHNLHELLRLNLSLDERLTICKELLRALQRLHVAGWLLLEADLKKLTWDREKKTLAVLDLGAALRKAKDGIVAKQPPHSLLYCSPEQTGRSNRRIDERSDFYLVGMIFYHILKGDFPLDGSDVMRAVHFHLAFSLPSLGLSETALSKALDLYIARMTAKTKEERYQSVAGALYDLEQIMQLHSSGADLEKFQLRTKDYSPELILSQKLYGREAELEALQQLLKNVDDGALEFAFIKGQAGIGKSSLIKEFMGSIDLDRYLAVSGKYRQLEQNEHLKGILLVCEQIIRKKAIGDDAALKQWLEQITESIGENWSILSSILPALKKFSDKTSVELQLTPAETRGRLSEALYRFIIGSASKEKPLILILDDIQWFDQGSKEILIKLANEEDSRYVLIMCTYRGDEVGETHEVSHLLRHLSKINKSYGAIDLPSIETTHIRELVQDSLTPIKGDLDELVRLIQTKTGGNPFFVKQLLFHIFDKGILKRDAGFNWIWDPTAILKLRATSNVIELLESRIAELDPGVRQLLLQVSCFDGRFNRLQLINWFGHDNHFLHTALSVLESENYIYSDKDRNFYIFHDRIREAAYGMLDEQSKRATHDMIGEKILLEYENNLIPENLVKAVSHLNKGIQSKHSVSHRTRLAGLNRDVAMRARSASAYDVALYFARQGLDLVQGNSSADQSLIFDLDLIRAECTFFAGDLKGAADIFARIEQIKVPVEKKARMYIVYMDLLHAENQFQEVVRMGREALKLFHIQFPKKISKISILFGLLRNKWLLSKLGIENLPKIPKINEDKIFLIQTLYSRIGSAGYFFDKTIYAYSVIHIFAYVIRHGADPSNASIGSFYSVLIAHRFGRYEEAYQIAMKCEDLRLNIGGIPYADRGAFAIGGFLLPWTRPIAEAKAWLEKAFQQLKRLGDPIVANFAALYLCYQKFQSGEKLGDVFAESQKFLKEVRKSGDFTISDCLVPNLIACARLQGQNPDIIFSDLEEDGSLDAFVTRIIRSEVENPRCWYGTQMLLVETIMRNRDQARELLKYSLGSIETVPFAFSIAFHHLCHALFCFDGIILGETEFSEVKGPIQTARKKMKTWYKSNPVTFEPFWCLLEAEYLVSQGNHSGAMTYFVRAMESAVKSENVMLQALSNERLGRHFLEQKFQTLGYRLLNASMIQYQNWGATAKAQQLLGEFPPLSVTQAGLASQSNQPSQNNLDVLSVVKSCQIIGNEMDLSTLLRQIVFLLIENAGAEHGQIYLMHENQLFLRAAAKGLQSEDVELQYKDLDRVDQVSQSLIRYVAKTQETVIIEDAQANELVRNDMYVRMAGCKSLLALPIVNQGKLIGVIWLENNSAAGLFNEKRAEVIELLANQAAISFENARLFGQEQEKMRMEGELRVAQTVQNTLFQEADGTTQDFSIAGSIEPASECGGDWWHYGAFGDHQYLCIGDATGHGVSAALITSAVRSAMASVAFLDNVNERRMIQLLNNSVAQTSKGQINMTMFLAVYNQKTRRFAYCNNSHEPTFHLPAKWLEGLRQQAQSDRAAAVRKFRNELLFLTDVTGPALGAHANPEVKSVEYPLAHGDYLLCYTDGVTEMFGPTGEMLGDRRFVNAVAEAFLSETDIGRIRSQIKSELKKFREEVTLQDDVTFFVAQYQ